MFTAYLTRTNTQISLPAFPSVAVSVTAAYIRSNQIMGWGEKAIEIRSVETGHLDGVFMHKRAQRLKFLCERNDKVRYHPRRFPSTLFKTVLLVVLYWIYNTGVQVWHATFLLFSPPHSVSLCLSLSLRSLSLSLSLSSLPAGVLCVGAFRRLQPGVLHDPGPHLTAQLVVRERPAKNLEDDNHGMTNGT